jgi:hypothetical protein
MRAHAVMVLLLSGCSLYLGPPSSSGDDSPPPDGRVTTPPDAGTLPDAWTPIDGGAPSGEMARCENGQLYAVPDSGLGDPPGHGAGRALGQCPGACRSAAVSCTRSDCRDAAETLCAAPISIGATCSLQGTACRGSGAIDCPESTACSTPVVGSTCTCTNGAYRCAQDTPAAKTQADIVGRWRGMVTPPEFAAPYPITLWIYPDGTYWPECEDTYCSAFYYGGDGPSPDRRITILSTSDSVGAWADITIDFGFSPPNLGALSALVVNATTLRFTFSASWHGCGQPFGFDLTRY